MLAKTFRTITAVYLPQNCTCNSHLSGHFIHKLRISVSHQVHQRQSSPPTARRASCPLCRWLSSTGKWSSCARLCREHTNPKPATVAHSTSGENPQNKILAAGREHRWMRFQQTLWGFKYNIFCYKALKKAFKKCVEVERKLYLQPPN